MEKVSWSFLYKIVYFFLDNLKLQISFVLIFYLPVLLVSENLLEEMQNVEFL